MWYGIGPYLKNILFCEMGDFIKVELDLMSYEARVELISDDVWNVICGVLETNYIYLTMYYLNEFVYVYNYWLMQTHLNV